MDTYHWIWETIERTDKTTGFVPLPQRWVVERTFGWFNWSRRLSKDYEILSESQPVTIQTAGSMFIMIIDMREIKQVWVGKCAPNRIIRGTI
jgi:Transposase DDE domain